MRRMIWLCVKNAHAANIMLFNVRVSHEYLGLVLLNPDVFQKRERDSLMQSNSPRPCKISPNGMIWKRLNVVIYYALLSVKFFRIV